MSRIDEWEIQAAFRTKLITVSGIPGSDNRAWENKGFSPTSGEPWIRENHIPAEERLSANNETEQVGIYQLDYFVPIGYSIKDAKNVATTIKDDFKPTTVLSDLVVIERSQVLRGRPDPDNPAWYMIPIELHYKVHGTNT